MFPDPSSLQARLAAVSRRLIAPQQIRDARADGVSSTANTKSLLPRGLSLSRANPILGAAFGLGVLECARQVGDSDKIARAQAVLGFALNWWGYYVEALPLLLEAAQTLDETHDRLLLEWHQ